MSFKNSVIVTFLGATQLIQVAVSGWSLIDQPCTPYQDQYNSCDPYAFLRCDTSGSRYVCRCSSPEFVWSKTVGRCTLRIGSPCYLASYTLRASRGRSDISNKNPDCPPSSYCDPRTNSCKCNPNHIPNYDGSACNFGQISGLRNGFCGGVWALIGLSVFAYVALK